MKKRLPNHLAIKFAAVFFVCLIGSWTAQVNNGLAQEESTIESGGLVLDNQELSLIHI